MEEELYNNKKNDHDCSKTNPYIIGIVVRQGECTNGTQWKRNTIIRRFSVVEATKILILSE